MRFELITDIQKKDSSMVWYKNIPSFETPRDT